MANYSLVFWSQSRFFSISLKDSLRTWVSTCRMDQVVPSWTQCHWPNFWRFQGPQYEGSTPTQWGLAEASGVRLDRSWQNQIHWCLGRTGKGFYPVITDVVPHGCKWFWQPTRIYLLRSICIYLSKKSKNISIIHYFSLNKCYIYIYKYIDR